MKILIAEDDEASANLLCMILRKAGYEPTVEINGYEALKRLYKEPFPVLLTDWMMPEMDGLELIRRVRKEIHPNPLIMMVTAVSSPESREKALNSGADDYLVKPYKSEALCKTLEQIIKRSRQPASPIEPVTLKKFSPIQDRVAICIAASTGGPEALRSLLTELDSEPFQNTSFFIVQHGPGWMLETFAERLQSYFPMPMNLARDGCVPQPGQGYLAPGERHMVLQADPLKIRLVDDPPENYVRPSADPLFRSAASAFGRNCLGVVLTGMGRDGTAGSAHIVAAGGTVLVQDPETTVVPAMPDNVVKAGYASKVVPLEDLGRAVSNQVRRIMESMV